MPVTKELKYYYFLGRRLFGKAMKYPLLRMGHFPEWLLKRKLYLDFTGKRSQIARTAQGLGRFLRMMGGQSADRDARVVTAFLTTIYVGQLHPGNLAREACCAGSGARPDLRP